MTQNNLKSSIRKFTPQKRRAAAEVISSLLLVAITVVGAVILTSFLDETFISGSLAVTSGTDITIKTVKLRAYDTRDGGGLMGYNIDNDHVFNLKLCRVSCNPINGGSTNDIPDNDGSEFLVIQFENRGINSIFLRNIYLDNVNHLWDPATINVGLDGAVSPLAGGVYPSDGTFSILSNDISDLIQKGREIQGGQTVNVLIKLHSDLDTPDIELSKTMRVQLNIGQKSLAEFLIESGDAR